MSCSGTGKFEKITEGDKSKNQHGWYPPAAASGDPISEGKLLILNTLTGKKDVFVPMNGRTVKWYVCGPTVYDSSHVGHARTYITFDIMRRIFTDYFNYNVCYQMNVTDIDDKIIQRARENLLISNLENDSEVDFKKLCELIDVAFKEAKTVGDSKTEKFKKDIAEAKSTKNSRALKESEGLLQMHLAKMSNLSGDIAAVEDAKKKRR